MPALTGSRGRRKKADRVIVVVVREDDTRDDNCQGDCTTHWFSFFLEKLSAPHYGQFLPPSLPSLPLGGVCRCRRPFQTSRFSDSTRRPRPRPIPGPTIGGNACRANQHPKVNSQAFHHPTHRKHSPFNASNIRFRELPWSENGNCRDPQRKGWIHVRMMSAVSRSSSSGPRGTLRCVERCWPSMLDASTAARGA